SRARCRSGFQPDVWRRQAGKRPTSGPRLTDDRAAQERPGHEAAFLAAAEDSAEAAPPRQNDDPAVRGGDKLAAAYLPIALPEQPGAMALECVFRRGVALEAGQARAESPHDSAAFLWRNTAQPALAAHPARGMRQGRGHVLLLGNGVSFPA